MTDPDRQERWLMKLLKAERQRAMNRARMLGGKVPVEAAYERGTAYGLTVAINNLALTESEDS